MKALVRKLLKSFLCFFERNFIDQCELVKKIDDRLIKIEDTVNMLSRTQPKRGRKIKTVFLVHHATSWIATLPVAKTMSEDPRFETILVSLPHIHLMSKKNNLLEGEQEIHEMLDTQGFEHIRIKKDSLENTLPILKSINPDVIFRQTPWNHDLPSNLNAQSLSFIRICYIPYGYMTAAIEEKQYNQSFHQLCWRIFCPDQIDRELFHEYNVRKDEACIVTGYPKFDSLVSSEPCCWPIPHIDNATSIFKLIWAPHWSFKDEWLKFGSFSSSAPEMLRLAENLPYLQIVLRPHPVLTEYIEQSSPESFLGNFIKEWNKLPNTAFSRESDYGPLFASSDALLTDGVSFLSEYQLFDKPLIFIQRPDSIGFNKAGKRLLDGLYRISDTEPIEPLLLKLLNGEEEQHVKACRSVISKELRPYPGMAAQNIIDAIYDGLMNNY
jgi:hypothetical protein